MRIKSSFLYKKLKLCVFAFMLCLGIAGAVFVGLNIFAAPMADDARIDEDQDLTYYITVNSDGIDWTGTESSDSITVDEVSGITTVTDYVPAGLTFVDFVTSSDGTFGAVQRDDESVACAGKVIDDTNEEGVDSGVWNDQTNKYTYHGLHYDANTRKVTFRTKGITAGCKLTVGYVAHTPTLPDNQLRADYYNTARFVDESLTDKSNTVHAYIQKSIAPGTVSHDTPSPGDGYYPLRYRYDGIVPQGAPELPATQWYLPQSDFTMAEKPSVECYSFDGWNWTPFGAPSSVVYTDPYSALGGKTQAFELVFYGSFTRTCEGDVPPPEDVVPEKYSVSYEIEGDKPSSFKIPGTRSYLEGSSVEIDDTREGDIFDGYDFSGWDTSSVDVEDGLYFSMPSRDVVLRGSFDREEYTLSYDFYGDVLPPNAESLLPASETHHAGDTITIAPAVSAEGYTFSGWMAEDSFAMPEKDVVIYGEWTKNQEEFTPDLAIEITNPKDKFHVGDMVEFKITVTNNQDFDLTEVWLEELLEGARFVSGDGYSIEMNTFAKIDIIPAGGEQILYAEFPVEKNATKVYTNTIELIAATSSDENYSLPEEWDNKASVDFETEANPDLPVDEPEDKNANTFDGLGKFVGSSAALGLGLAASIFVLKRFRRGGIVYGYVAVIISVSGLSVALINGFHIFADSLTETPWLDIYSANSNYSNGDAGAWKVNESASWVSEGRAKLRVTVDSKRISDLHNKDVVLILDNSKWSANAIDGTPLDNDSDLSTLEIMKNGASEFVTDLLDKGDSRVMVMSTWGVANLSFTDDINEIIPQINAIQPTGYTNNNSYDETYSKILTFLDNYESSEDRALNIVYVTDEHLAKSGDIVKYRMAKAKAPNATISGIGIGVMELMRERYVSFGSADEDGVARYWFGVDGNAHPVGYYTHALQGLEYITDYYDDPYERNYTASLTNCVDTSLKYSKFNINTTINTDEFDFVGIYGNVGDIDLNGNVVSWTNEGSEGFVSGATYEMSILLEAKNHEVVKHKLYQVNTGTTIETNAADVAAENVTSSENVVLMNGFELSFNINNDGVCELGDNRSGVYLAFQKVSLDEDGVSCEGWNFDSFKDPDDGSILNSKFNEMPAKDVEMMATWRKTDVEIHMDGTIYTVAPATLMDGLSFNQKLWNLTGSNYNTLLLRADACPKNIMDEAHRFSDDESPTAVYIWSTPGSGYEFINPNTGEAPHYYPQPAYYCTDANEIYLNEDSAHMFSNLGFKVTDDEGIETWIYPRSRLQYIDEDIASWNASNVKDMNHMFSDAQLGLVTYKYISNWDVSSVENMDYAFSGDSFSSAIGSVDDNLLAWNTPNLKSMDGAFYGTSYIVDVAGGLKSWNVSGVTTMDNAFYNSRMLTTDNLSTWSVDSVTSTNNTFGKVYGWYDAGSYTGTDFSGISNWNVSNVQEMEGTFEGAYIDDLSDLQGWDVSNVSSFRNMFASAHLNTGTTPGTLTGIGSWTTTNATDMSYMFSQSDVVDLQALSGWASSNTANVENMAGMFRYTNLTSLDGIDGWSTGNVKNLSSFVEGNYELSDLDALDDWDVSEVTTLSSAFQGISADDLMALHDWDVSKVEDMSYTFCGAPQQIGSFAFDCSNIGTGQDGGTRRTAYGGVKSLHGVESINGEGGWNTASLKNMDMMLASNETTDLSPLSSWNVESVESMKGTFMGMNVSDYSDLSEWKTYSLKTMNDTFRHSIASDLDGLENWDVEDVTVLFGTFADMYNLEDISALSNWKTSSLTNISLIFANHKKLSSLHGLENWDVSKLETAHSAFLGYSPYTYSYWTDWSKYCSSSLTDIEALGSWELSSSFGQATMFLACNNKLVDISPLNSWHLKQETNDWFYLDRFFEGDSKVTTLNGIGGLFCATDGTCGYGRTSFNYMFMNMTSLRDVSALSGWRVPDQDGDGNNLLGISSAESMFRNDKSITDLSPLENCVIKTVRRKTNMFDGIPSSVARPSWY